MTHAPSWSNCAETGTRRTWPVLRPTVSSSVAIAVRSPSLLSPLTAGLSKRPTARSRRNFRNVLSWSLFVTAISDVEVSTER
jgi:hypothetical protein